MALFSEQSWLRIRQVFTTPRSRFILQVVMGYIVFSVIWFLWAGKILLELADPQLVVWQSHVNELAFVAVSTMLMVLVLRVAPPSPPITLESQGRPWPLLSVLLILTLTLAIVGALAFHSLSSSLRSHQFDALGAIARLKSAGVASWLEERRADADALAHNSTLRIALSGWLKYSDDADREQILALLENVRGTFNYNNIALLDPTGRLLLEVGPSLQVSDQIAAAAQETMRTGALTLVDIHRRPTDTALQLGYVAPIATSAGGKMPAVIFLAMRPNSYLFPLIQFWPLPSASGETLLIRHDGAEIVYLNELRHRPGAALSLRQTLDNKESVVNQALHAQEGLISGKDYRQVRVLAVAQPVPETPWTLIAKVDEHEAVAGIYNLAWVAGGLTLAALAVAAAFIGMLWQQQRLRITLNELAQVRALETAERRFRATFEQVAVGIAHVSPDGHWMRVNQRLCEIVGYSRMDLMELTFRDLRPPEDKDAEVGAMARLLTGIIPHDQWEQRCRRYDGTTVWIAITASLVRDAAGRPDYFITIIEDISARKFAEERVTRLTGIARILIEANQAILRVHNRRELFSEVCRIAVIHGGFRLACINNLSSEPPVLTLQASYGPALELIDQPELNEWHGVLQQIMAVVWRGEHYICADTLASQFFTPWSELFNRYDIHSFAIFPLRDGQSTNYALLVYAPQINYFDPDMVKLLDEMALDISFGLEKLAQDY